MTDDNFEPVLSESELEAVIRSGIHEKPSFFAFCIVKAIARDIEKAAVLADREKRWPHPWNEGVPTHVYDEWFIAVTTYGDKVVLRALPEEYTYDYTTADGTYIMRDKIARWMQFPESEYVTPAESFAKERDQLRQQVAELIADRDGWQRQCEAESLVSESYRAEKEQQAARIARLEESLELCRSWFEKHSPTAPLIGDLGHAEHPMLTSIKAAIADAPLTSDEKEFKEQARRAGSRLILLGRSFAELATMNPGESDWVFLKPCIPFALPEFSRSVKAAFTKAKKTCEIQSRLVLVDQRDGSWKQSHLVQVLCVEEKKE